jgi:hypothetical protein
MRNKTKLPACKVPCSNCPFRKDTLKGWLGKRIDEILEQDSFVCHKTIEDDSTRLQCAGHMILLKEDNQFYRLATGMGFDLELKNDHLVFNNKEDCSNHHKTF